MRIVNLKQNTKEWLDWRGKGIGASNAPVVMGVSPWQAPFELWLEMVGICPRGEPNAFAVAAMRRGQELEPKAREMFVAATGIKADAVSAEHDEYPWIRASFDGYSADNGGHILEIKCPGKVDHAKAVKGQVPDKYYPQIQQQFLVSGAQSGTYYSWDGVSAQGVAVPIKPDADYITKLLLALQSFWSRVQMRVPPEASRADLERFTGRLIAEMARVQATVKGLEALSAAMGG